jgi:hypothetical protein
VNKKSIFSLYSKKISGKNSGGYALPPYDIKTISFFLFHITFKPFINQEKFGGVRPLRLLLFVMEKYSGLKK